MPVIQSSFKPPYIWRNRHLQTLWPRQMRRLCIPTRRSIWMKLSDGDSILLEQVMGDDHSQQAVLLIHGLSGCADSHYIVALQILLHRLGITSLAMNFRGSKIPNRMARGYHSGSSDDLGEVIDFLHKYHSNYSWHAIGFSLGGNVLLKYLGEKNRNPLLSAVAISVPLCLDVCATQLDKGFSRIYRNHLLKELKQYWLNKRDFLSVHNPEQARLLAQAPIEKTFTSFWDFDHQIIAPLHGYHSVEDYYQRCSSRQFLKEIRTPTHILQALDDPFMSEEVLPEEQELSAAVTLELSFHGGHAGFYSGNNNYYIENFFASYLKLRAN